MAGLTLDAGALIAIDRGARDATAFAMKARLSGATITVPAAALAQAWRGDRNARLAQFLKGCSVESLSAEYAPDAGALCGRAGTSDIIDASVVASAARRGDAIITSDPGDIQRLASFVRNLGPVIVI